MFALRRRAAAFGCLGSLREASTALAPAGAGFKKGYGRGAPRNHIVETPTA